MVIVDLEVIQAGQDLQDKQAHMQETRIIHLMGEIIT